MYLAALSVLGYVCFCSSSEVCTKSGRCHRIFPTWHTALLRRRINVIDVELTSQQQSVRSGLQLITITENMILSSFKPYRYYLFTL